MNKNISSFVKMAKTVALVLISFSFLCFAGYEIIFKTKNIELINEYPSLSVGDIVQLEYAVYPNTSNTEGIDAIISDGTILENIGDNKIKALKEGTVTLTLEKDGKSFSSYQIEVKEIELKSISFKDKEIKVNVGDEYTPVISFSPNDATYTDYVLNSDDINIIEIKNGNTIVAKKEGEVTITVVSKKGLKNTVNVLATPVEATDISINKIDDLDIGDSKQLAISWKPNNVTYKDVTWSCSDNNVATINESGELEGLKEGTVQITAITSNGVSNSIDVSIVPVLATSISIDEVGQSLKIGDAKELEINWEPSNVSYKNIEWSSSDNSIAAVNSSGKVVALKDGKAVITATDKNSGVQASVNIEVVPVPVSSINISSNSTSLYTGGGTNVYASIEPSNATYKDVTFTSSDESVATVNEYGYVSAVSSGSAYIYATSSNGKKSSVKISVEDAPIVQQKASVSNYTSSSSSNDMVWISSSGTKYHRRSNCSNMKNPWQVTLQDAINQGRSPCKKCY